MIEIKLGDRYANSILVLAQERGQVERVREDFYASGAKAISMTLQSAICSNTTVCTISPVVCCAARLH
jgi:hypothetical protein